MIEQHTPGPWMFDNDWYRIPSIMAGNVKIACVEKQGFPDRSSSTPEQQANARLLSAAPDMLEALQTAAWLLADISPDGLVSQKVDAAIAKASMTTPSKGRAE